MSNLITVEVINFGDELLVGIRENSHLKYIGERLSHFGVSIARARVIVDEPSEIERAFADAWEHADVVITTGGLGPTADDLTRETIAQALGLELVYDAAIEATIQDRFSVLGRTMGPQQLKQCYRFADGEALHNERGTAPGLLYQHGGKTLIMLPGPPHELQPMFEKQVLPRLQADGALAEAEAYALVRSCGAGESSVEQRMQPLVEQYPALSVAYCVHYSMVDVRLSCRDASLSQAQLQSIAHEARHLLGDDFVSFGHRSLAQVVHDEVRALERTLAVAESCTGGALGAALTDVAGASEVFVGGMIAYSNEVKIAMLGVPESLIEQHGAVSPECAVAMATGAAEQFSTDYALSVTGYAGPAGGDAANPVGTMHIGYYSPVGVWSKTVRYTGERVDVKERVVQAALDMMRRKLRKYKMEEFLSSELPV